MSDEAQRQAMNILPPVSSATFGVGVCELATSTVSASYDLDPYNGIFNRYIDLIAEGGDIYVLFAAASGITIVGGAGGSTLANGTATTVPDIIFNTQRLPVRLTKTAHRYMYVRAKAGTPTLRIRPSSQQRLSDLSLPLS